MVKVVHARCSYALANLKGTIANHSQTNLNAAILCHVVIFFFFFYFFFFFRLLLSLTVPENAKIAFIEPFYLG